MGACCSSTAADTSSSELIDLAVPLVVATRECSITTTNRAADELFGFDRGELVGQNVKVLMDAEQAGRHDGYVQRYVQTGSKRVIGTRGREVIARRKDGTSLPVLLTVVETAGGSFVASFVDMRAALKLKQEVATRQMVSYVSHETRVPLNAVVIGLHEALALSTEDRVRDVLDDAVVAVASVQRVLNDTLTLHKLQAGKFQFSAGWFSVLRFMSLAARFVKLLARERRQKVDVDVPGALVGQLMWADRARLLQVMQNYCSNAARYAPEGGSIVLRVVLVHDGQLPPQPGVARRAPGSTPLFDAAVEGARAPAGGAGDGSTPREVAPVHCAVGAPDGASTGNTLHCVRFEVSDNGPGIPDDLVGQLFQPFVQLNKGSSGGKVGTTGLGLSICKSIVEEGHGGSVGVSSRLGVGTTFYAEAPFWMRDGTGSRLLKRGSQATTMSSFSDGDDDFVSARSPRNATSPAARGTPTTAGIGSPDRRASGADDAVVEAAGTEATAAADDAPVSPDDVEVSHTDGSVLVVDDDAMNRKMMTRWLQRLGVTTHTASNGQEAVDFVRAGAARPAVVLMDMVMPVMGGLEACRLIEAIDGSPPVIGVTGNAMEEGGREFLSAGAVSVVSKPVNLRRLLRLLQTYGVAEDAADAERSRTDTSSGAAAVAGAGVSRTSAAAITSEPATAP